MQRKKRKYSWILTLRIFDEVDRNISKSNGKSYLLYLSSHIMFKLIGWCLFLIFGYIQSNAQNFQPKLFYYPSTNAMANVHKQQEFKLSKLKVHSFSLSKPHTIHLFKTMPNPYQPKKRLPVFCEIEHQISKLIKRRMKLGVP